MEGDRALVGVTHESDHAIAQTAPGLDGVAAARARIPSGGKAPYSYSPKTKATFLSPVARVAGIIGGIGPLCRVQVVANISDTDTPTMKSTSCLFVALLFLVGCATPFRAPPDVREIKLERVDSPVVDVEKIWLERKNGPLVLKGYVLKQLTARDTTQTHLDVTLYDSAGRVLRSTVEYFEPRQIRHQWRRSSFGSYSVVLDPLPAGTARIEVRAHEGVHPSP